MRRNTICQALLTDYIVMSMESGTCLFCMVNLAICMTFSALYSKPPKYMVLHAISTTCNPETNNEGL